MQVCEPSAHAPTPRRAGGPRKQAWTSPAVHGQPSSMLPSQSSSTPLHSASDPLLSAAAQPGATSAGGWQSSFALLIPEAPPLLDVAPPASASSKPRSPLVPHDDGGMQAEPPCP